MTEREKNYRWNRFLKDRQDARYYEKEIKYWLKLIPLAGLSYIVGGIALAIFG